MRNNIRAANFDAVILVTTSRRILPQINSTTCLLILHSLRHLENSTPASAGASVPRECQGSIHQTNDERGPPGVSPKNKRRKCIDMKINFVTPDSEEGFEEGLKSEVFGCLLASWPGTKPRGMRERPIASSHQDFMHDRFLPKEITLCTLESRNFPLSDRAQFA